MPSDEDYVNKSSEDGVIIYKMGAEFEFNWILKLTKKDLENLTLEGNNSFTKEGKRIYPIDTLIFLTDEEFNVKGIVTIPDYSNINGKTCGHYKIIEIPGAIEKKVLSKYIRGMYLDKDF